jgi:hypothetical protein
VPPTRFLSGNEVWDTIDRLAASTNRPRKIAVAFVGPGAFQRLRLKRGDSLHCALSVRNARTGVVCPADLQKLRRRGIKLFAEESLHAKIYLFGNTAVIGSANLSNTSRRLDEAALLVTQPEAVSLVREWFDAREAIEVSDQLLNKCKAAYRPPRWNPFLQAARRVTARQTKAERVWMLWGLRDEPFNAAEERLAARAKSDAQRRRPRSEWGQLRSIGWDARGSALRDVRVGDKIICVWVDNSRPRITPYGTCFGARRAPSVARARRAVFAIEFPNSDVELDYAKLVRRCRSAGIAIPSKGRTVCITDPRQVRVIKQLTSPEGMRARK